MNCRECGFPARPGPSGKCYSCFIGGTCFYVSDGSPYPWKCSSEPVARLLAAEIRNRGLVAVLYKVTPLR